MDTTCYSLLGHVLFWQTNFCANGHLQLEQLCHVIQRDMLNVYHSPAHFIFVSFTFLSHFVSLTETVSAATESSSYALPVVVVAPYATPTHWAFYFQGAGLPLFISDSWSNSNLFAGLILPFRSFKQLHLCCIKLLFL